MADFRTGWARVTKPGDEYEGKVGEVTAVDIEPSGIWVTLRFKTGEVMFERWEVMECPAPKQNN